jgi:hypothetical protein
MVGKGSGAVTRRYTARPAAPLHCRPMRARTLLAALAGAAVLSAGAVAPAGAETAGVIAHMSCVGPRDAAGIDAMLSSAGSPLAGEGAVFVEAAGAEGIDPRALVAIAAHETLLETYLPSQAIRNAFGLGPGIAFASEEAAIRRAARVLGDYYVAEGRVTLADIGAKWAPVGVANDPDGLNRNWTAGVGAYFAALGGDPSRPVLAASQDAVPDCAGAPALSPAQDATTPPGPPVVTVWGGAPPRIADGTPAHGADPATGDAAVIAGFAFPLAVGVDAPVAYRDAFSEPGPDACGIGRHQCAVTIASEPGDAVVAMAAGTLRAADATEREAGIAFWIETDAGDRLGYGPLAGYEPGIGEGARVAAGRHLGAGAGWVRIAWERGGERIAPFPLLEATRPPSA